jgi:hypothetical protein
MRPLYQEVLPNLCYIMAAALKSLIGWNLNRFDVVNTTFPMLLVMKLSSPIAEKQAKSR